MITIPFIDLVLQNTNLEKPLLKAAEKVLRSGCYILGPCVEEFERLFADHCGTRFAVGVNSGTDALIFGLTACGIGSGDEVITVPNTFVATVSAIVACGAKPVFIDVTSDMNMNVDMLEAVITDRTKAILPVHLTGRPVNMNVLLQISKKFNLEVIEDAAQAVGAEFENRRAGSFGSVGCFSLHPLKNLGGLGDGGIITTNDENMANKLKLLRNFGLSNRSTVNLLGTNSRLDEIQAAFLSVKIDLLNGKKEV